jgi:hypothetical protein
MQYKEFNLNAIEGKSDFAQVINELAQEKNIPNLTFNAAFKLAVKHVYNGSPIECARELEVSVNSVRSWLNGNAPTSMNRRMITRLIDQDIKKALTPTG